MFDRIRQVSKHGKRSFESFLAIFAAVSYRSFTNGKKFFSENEPVDNHVKKFLEKSLYEQKGQITFVTHRRYPEKLR